MKRLNFTLIALLLSATASFAQLGNGEHGEIGAYAEYLRFQALDHSNFGGLGGRLSFNLHKTVQLEAEVSYIFRQGFHEDFSNGIPSGVLGSDSQFRAINGLFGPKLQLPWRFRPFVTVKGGFINSEFDPGQGPGPGFTSQINNFRRSNTNGVLYPGGGVEGYWGPLGLRFDVGDEVIFNRRHANHNLRMTFGPHIRF